MSVVADASCGRCGTLKPLLILSSEEVGIKSKGQRIGPILKSLFNRKARVWGLVSWQVFTPRSVPEAVEVATERTAQACLLPTGQAGGAVRLV
jgi:hypothetical protein